MTILTKDKFKKWLESKNGGYVGTAFSPFACPIAHYMREKAGGNWVVDASVWQRGSDAEYPREGWIDKFIRAADASSGSRYIRRRITAAKALEILEQI